MNAGPGKIALALSILIGSLLASDYRYSLHISKHSLYLKEPLLVSFDINQTDPSKVMFFDFSPRAGDAFFVQRLDKRVDEGYHARKERYLYLIYPLKSGEVTLDFDLLVRRGNDDLLTTAFTGGRYNVKAVETEDRHEEIPPQKIEVKALPVKADIVGTFTLERRIEKRKVHPFEPLYIDIEVRGTGYAPDIVNRSWLPKIEGVKLFADKPKVELRYTKRGIETKALFTYAVISQKDYLVPAIHLQAFDTGKGEPYTIEEPAVKIRVEPIESGSLTDLKTLPPPAKSPVEGLKNLLFSLFIFAAGWISALLAARLRGAFGKKGEKDEWKKMVKSTKDARSLLKLLVLKDAKRYEPWIERLEYALYKEEKIDLKAIKQEVLREK